MTLVKSHARAFYDFPAIHKNDHNRQAQRLNEAELCQEDYANDENLQLTTDNRNYSSLFDLDELIDQEVFESIDIDDNDLHQVGCEDYRTDDDNNYDDMNYLSL